jgi:hypothetical protein
VVTRIVILAAKGPKVDDSPLKRRHPWTEYFTR